jgi:hypothetical protein
MQRLKCNLLNRDRFEISRRKLTDKIKTRLLLMVNRYGCQEEYLAYFEFLFRCSLSDNENSRPDSKYSVHDPNWAHLDCTRTFVYIPYGFRQMTMQMLHYYFKGLSIHFHL